MYIYEYNEDYIKYIKNILFYKLTNFLFHLYIYNQYNYLKNY